MGLYGSPDAGNLYSKKKEPRGSRRKSYKLIWILLAINVFILALVGISKDDILTILFLDSIIVFVVSFIKLIYNIIKGNKTSENAIFIVLSIVIFFASALSMNPVDTKNSVNQQQSLKQGSNSQIGRRKTPAQIGDTVRIDVTDNNGLKFNIEIELLETKRGKGAEELIKAIDDFSGEPGEDKEYMFAKFRVKNVENKSGKDVPFNLGYNYFNYATGDYKKYENTAMITGPNILSTVELYEGAEHTGWVCLYVNKNDSHPRAVFLDGEGIWFDL